ncbi:MAG: nicotinate-nucleotide adenylyltransferase [Calditrichia bacterium]|nr:nicotinate-nucleotide adenylyltransferase [Calditrichia bacterium]
MSKIQKIGLFGGTFDPIHIGHLVVAESVLNELSLDNIYFIPAHKHALKSNKKITSPEIRLELLKTALKDFSYFAISDIELKSSNVSFTIDTLKNFKVYEKLSNVELFYIIGFDNLSELHLWKDNEKIMEMAQFVVLIRQGGHDEHLINKYKNRIIVPKSPQIDISSTLIRQRIKENKLWKSMVTPAVQKYIIRHNLYK